MVSVYVVRNGSTDDKMVVKEIRGNFWLSGKKFGRDEVVRAGKRW